MLPAVEVTKNGDKTLVNLGQNVVGWVRLRIPGRDEQKITIRHAEVLENGNLGASPWRLFFRVIFPLLRSVAITVIVVQ